MTIYILVCVLVLNRLVVVEAFLAIYVSSIREEEIRSRKKGRKDREQNTTLNNI